MMCMIYRSSIIPQKESLWLYIVWKHNIFCFKHLFIHSIKIWWLLLCISQNTRCLNKIASSPMRCSSSSLRYSGEHTQAMMAVVVPKWYRKLRGRTWGLVWKVEDQEKIPKELMFSWDTKNELELIEQRLVKHSSKGPSVCAVPDLEQWLRI